MLYTLYRIIDDVNSLHSIIRSAYALSLEHIPLWPSRNLYLRPPDVKFGPYLTETYTFIYPLCHYYDITKLYFVTPDPSAGRNINAPNSGLGQTNVHVDLQLPYFYYIRVSGCTNECSIISCGR